MVYLLLNSLGCEKKKKSQLHILLITALDGTVIKQPCLVSPTATLTS